MVGAIGNHFGNARLGGQRDIFEPLVPQTGFGFGGNAGHHFDAFHRVLASTGFSGRVLANGDITINGSPVSWNLVASIPSSISSNNSLADVTSIVKPIVDAA